MKIQKVQTSFGEVQARQFFWFSEDGLGGMYRKYDEKTYASMKIFIPFECESTRVVFVEAK